MNKKIAIRMNDIDNKLDELQKSMEEIWNLLNEMKSDFTKSNAKMKSKEYVKQENKIIVLDNRSKWKKEVYAQIKILINSKHLFKRKSEVLHYIYNYMRKNYGIVWEQDIKEYKEYFKTEYKPKTIDIVYENKMYKSIFEAVLADLVANTSNNSNCELEM